MKELSIKEKAKRYDKALEIAKSLYDYSQPISASNVIINNIFPELRESEEEKTRKEIVEFLKKNLHLDWAIWLEKQGEQNLIMAKSPQLGEQKPAWGEEDEYYYGIVQYILNNECVGKADRENAITWYNFLKDRVHPQSRPAWSEEDEIAFGDTLWCCKQAASISKDENEMGNAWYAERWLKSIRDRYTWKPSDKQIEVLWKYAEQSNYDGMLLTSLYNDLKKLREK